MGLADYRREMELCQRCSACKFMPLEKVEKFEHVNVCPSISRYNFHAYSGGGRMVFGVAMLENRIDYSDKLLEIVYNCQMCGACDVSCKYSLDMEVLEPLNAMRIQCVEDGHTLPALDSTGNSLRKQGSMVPGPKAKKGQCADGLKVKDATKQKAKVLYHTGCRTKEYAWCCGAGGGVKETNPDFAAWTARERMAEAEGTGVEALATACPGCIKIDLRRMNRILEINEKNIYAVVEPYVIYAQLQAELMKRGLNCNVTGAGSNCSALPLAAHANLGHLSQTGSFGERNQLALEWVTGDGEIIRISSLGSCGQWFSGDGPGPSLRGIIRGNTVPLGGLGVFTKAAQKVYQWPGPAKFPIEGICPHYAPSRIPPGFMIRYLSFATIDKLIEAVRKIGESEIGFELMGFNVAMMAANVSTSNEEDVKYFRQFTDSVQGPGFMLMIAGTSPRDFEYKKKVLKKIIEETGAWSLKPVEDPELGASFLWRFIRTVGSIRETARASGTVAPVVGGTDIFPLMTRYILDNSDVKQDLIKGLSLDESVYPFIQSIEHGHTGHGEILVRYAPSSPDSIPDVQGTLMREANRRNSHEFHQQRR